MKYCTQCGQELSASAHFCENCGTQYLDPTISPKVQEIEINTANYYNATFPPLDPRGRYIVAHENTIIRNDVCYMQVHFEQPGTLGGNPIRITIADVSVNMVTGHITTKQKYSKPTPPTQVRTGCIVMLVIGLFCWFFTPFFAGDWDKDLSAIVLLGRILEYSSFSEYAFVFVIPFIGMVLCLICESTRSRTLSFIFSLISLLCLVFLFIAIAGERNEILFILQLFGLGFWVPVISLFTVFFADFSD